MPDLTHMFFYIATASLSIAGVFAIVIAAKKIRQIKVDFSTRQLEINFENKNRKSIVKVGIDKEKHELN